MNWYLKVLKQYVDFDGRARRKEYWMFFLFNTIFTIIAALLDNVLGITFSIDTFSGEQAGYYGYIYLIYNLFILIPNLAVAVRRLHDTGNSGWMILILMLPLIGFIWIFVLTLIDSKPGPNKWGPNPKDDNSGSPETLDGNVTF